MRRITKYLMLIAGLILVFNVSAHDTRPLYVEIKEQALNEYSVNWKVPITVAATNIPQITMPQSCRPNGPVLGTTTARSQGYRCTTDLSNETVSISFPRYNPSISTLMHFNRISGESYTEVLGPEVTEWVVPEKEHVWKVARDYMVLGIEHILEGYDHLLFIVCLVLLAGTFRRVIITITGFTISHSITLAMASLGVVKVSVAPVEASVALSIVFVATELARNKRDTLTWRYPIAVSSTFGLLHGFGFAAVLSEIGLPQTEVPAALLFFNIGVEIGQIAFVVASVILFRFVSMILPKLRKFTFSQVLGSIQRPAAYVVGTLAAFWTMDRIHTFWI